MKYAKPQVVVIGAAISAIQGLLNKSGSAQDDLNPEAKSTDAYQSDE